MQKKQKRDSLSVSVGAQESPEDEIEVDKVSEKVPMATDKSVSTEGQSGGEIHS